MAKSKTKTVFSCQNCGAQRPKWEGRCSDCGSWNSYIEEVASEPDQGRGWKVTSPQNEGRVTTIKLNESVQKAEVRRASTSIGELDRVLGGGLVPGSFVLLGGDPGIGKSTLLMQMAGGLAKSKSSVLYVSGEESVTQTSLRAQRLGVHSELVEVAAESNLETIQKLAKEKRPHVLIVDSIQTVYLSQLNSAPGSVSQVRECAGHLMALAKTEGISVLLIGHVTKDGTIAGPKVLEHMVDTVLSFEGDMNHHFRLLRALKNRFGATNELGVFRMQSAGLEEVQNPSELFLEERGSKLEGSTVFAAMEGTRPLLCEVQALTTSTPMAMPRRTALGVDVNRVHLLCAVLSKHADLDLGHRDVFVNVVGGLQLQEPAADLAIAAALLSSEEELLIPPKMVFFGEVGLTGEVRAVGFAESRVKESAKLGFEQFVVPVSNQRHLVDMKPAELKKIVWIQQISELRKVLSSNKNKV